MKDLAKHLKGGNSEVGDIHWLQTVKDFLKSPYNDIGCPITYESQKIGDCVKPAS